MAEDLDIILLDFEWNGENLDFENEHGSPTNKQATCKDALCLSSLSSNGFKCSYCFKMFADEKTLHRHVVQHSNKEYQCMECDKEYVTAVGLMQHVNSVHSHCRPFCCDFCDKAFNQKAHLKEHMRVHTAEKQHVCGMCGREFTTKVNLRRHMVRHTGQRPFRCPACGKSFAVQPDLDRHVKRIHSTLTTLCDVCGIRLRGTQDLHRHFERHHRGQYSCDHCEQSFARFRPYQRHLLKHFHFPPECDLSDMSSSSSSQPTFCLPTL